MMMTHYLDIIDIIRRIAVLGDLGLSDFSCGVLY